MKILVINGSPKGERSNTLKLADAFVEGISTKCETEVRKVTLVGKDIKFCLGCFSCWGATPGECIIKDDMEAIRKDILWADLIVESFPLYFFGMPGQMKTFTDRMLPFTESYLGESAENKEGGFHEMRFDKSGKRLVVITTCGYTDTKKIYDSLTCEYDFFAGKNACAFVKCPQGELFGIPQFGDICNARLSLVKKAGEEFALEGDVKEATIESIGSQMIPGRAFSMILSKNWEESRKRYLEKHGDAK